LESYYKFAKKTLCLILKSVSLYLPLVGYIVNENYGAGNVNTVGNKFAIFQYQFTSTVY